jgi:xyloglucan-specific exo-beta-1,4-glucanase
VNGNKFYAFMQGVMYYSANGGSSFTASATTGIPTDNVKVKAVFGREGEVWAAGGAAYLNAYGLWRSSDSGVTYTKITNVEGAENVTFGKPAVVANYPVIFISGTVGGVRGVFKSEDIGATWIRINDDAHQFGTFGQPALCGDPRTYGRVYVATNGRGIFIGDLAGGVQMAAPVAPSALTATAVSTGQINLTWADNSTNESTFVVDYATNPTFTTGLVTISPGYNLTGCRVNGLTPSTTYYFRVRAVNRDGSSTNSATASATTQSIPTTPPAAPTNLTAATASASAINLTWVDNSNNEGNFVIQRATDLGFTANVVNTTVAANTTSTQIGGLSNNTTYYFRVRAVNVFGASAYSNTASAKTSRR